MTEINDTLGSRQGTTASFDEGKDLHKAHKSEVREVLLDRARRALRCQDLVHADDVSQGVPDEHRNVIGSVLGSLVTTGEAVRVGDGRSQNASTHSRRSGLYRAGPNLAGVAAGAPRPQGPDGPADPPSASSDPGESHSQPGDSPGARSRPTGAAATKAATAGGGWEDDSAAGQLPLLGGLDA